MYKVVTTRTGELGGSQLGVNLDLGDWRELSQKIDCTISNNINKSSTRVKSTGNSLKSVEISKFGKTTLKIDTLNLFNFLFQKSISSSCNNKIPFTGI
ncbi:hypothetical protein JCM5350_007027 [Sporobolomyces pararoseus]